ncbi:MAG: hypothetical protein SPG61_06285 [Arcanobacterium sp.]|nr:hypothetical protein [Arcanobacterium sp.]
MSAISYAPARRNMATSRPVITAPTLRVVESPAPSAGFFGTAILCIVIFLSALCVTFYLNTKMASGAYEIKRLTVELNELKSGVETLNSEIVMKSSMAGLRTEAEKLGMVPATEIRYLDYKTGEIVAPGTRD